MGKNKAPKVEVPKYPKTKMGPHGPVELIDVAFGVPIYIYEPPVIMAGQLGEEVFPNPPLPSGVVVTNAVMRMQARRYWGVNVKVGDKTP